MAEESTSSPARWRLLTTLLTGLLVLGGLLVAPRVVNAAEAWAGRWQTNLGVMELAQDGSRVYGGYEADQGQIGGTAKGQVLTGTWVQAPSFQMPEDGGTLKLTMSDDGQSFTGRWRYGTSGAWEKSKWSGQRLPPEPTPSPSPDLVASIVPTPAADPVAVVDAFLDALVAKQWDKLPALMCSSKRGSVLEQSQIFGAAELKPLVDAMTIDIADRDVTLQGAIVSGVPWRASIDGALVDVAGQLSIAGPGRRSPHPPHRAVLRSSRDRRDHDGPAGLPSVDGHRIADRGGVRRAGAGWSARTSWSRRRRPPGPRPRRRAEGQFPKLGRG